MRLHPSFVSTEAFLQACQARDGMRLLNDVDEEYTRRIDELVANLQHWRSIRQPFAKDAIQLYDAACLTILTWLWGGMNDYRITPVYPFVVRLLPELMHMQDIQDNQELQRWAQVVLAAMAGLPYPAHLVSPILQTLLGQFKSSSWRTRLATLPLLQVFFFHQLFTLSEDEIREVVSTLRGLLKDAHVSSTFRNEH
jgi:proteasome activator subunit 4